MINENIKTWCVFEYFDRFISKLLSQNLINLIEQFFHR